MKKIFIFLSIFTILFFAYLDAKKLLSELEGSLATSRTPSQIEIRPLIKRETGKSDNVKFDSFQNQQHQNMRNDVKHDFQGNINKMSDKIKENREKQAP